jgi:hypothetical protein
MVLIQIPDWLTIVSNRSLLSASILLLLVLTLLAENNLGYCPDPISTTVCMVPHSL